MNETTNGQPARLAGHALVEALIAQGIDTVFGVPGESYLAVLDGFHEHRDKIRFIACRQEGGASFMAEAQGKLTGRPGICFVTRGPGATNASIGLHTAFQDSTPMILFVGDVGSRFFFLHTDATNYARTAFYDLLGGPNQTLSSEFSTFAPAPAVPEPSSVLLMSVGLAGIGVVARRRMRG